MDKQLEDNPAQALWVVHGVGLPLYVTDAIITAPLEAMRCGPAASYVMGGNACLAAMLEDKK